MRQKHTAMLLPFKIKLKKYCNKNASVVHLCSISEVVKPSSKMTLLYSKIAVAHASKITYTVLQQYFDTNKFKRNIAILLITVYTLILFRTVLRQEGLYHSYTKTAKYFTDQIQDGWPTSSILKKAGFRYGATKIHLGQSEVSVQRYFKKDCIHDALVHI